MISGLVKSSRRAAAGRALLHVFSGDTPRLATKDVLKLVDAGTVGRKAVAMTDLQPGTVINEFFEPVLPAPKMHTVMLDEGVHVAPTDGAEFISHQCEDTNTRIVVAESRREARFVVTQPVAAGEDLSFNYNTTEWDMDAPFHCQCPSCKRRPEGPRHVRGFKHLSPEDRLRIASEASPLVRDMAFREGLMFLNELQVLRSVEADYYETGDSEPTAAAAH